MASSNDEYRVRGSRGEYEVKGSDRSGREVKRTDGYTRRQAFSLFGMGLPRVVEFASAVPLIKLAYDNVSQGHTYSVVNVPDILVSEKPEQVQDLMRSSERFLGALKSLRSAYGEEYHKSRTEVYWDADEDGDPVLRTRTVWEWKEPSTIPDHEVVDKWIGYQSSFTDRARVWYDKPLVDRQRLDELRVVDEKTGAVFDTIVGGLVYGGQIAALLGYEEMGALLSGSRNVGVSVKDHLKTSQTPEQMSRRSFFKVGAAVVGAVATGVQVESNDEVLEQGRSDLEGRIAEVQQQSVVSSGDVFADYFGRSSRDLQDKTLRAVGISRKALELGVAQSSVESSFENVIEAGQQYASLVDELFEGGVSDVVSGSLNDFLLTEHLEGLSSDQKVRAKNSVLLEGLVSAGVMAGVLIPAELMNK